MFIRGFEVPNNDDLLAILYLSILSTVLAYIWFVVGVEKIGATSARPMCFSCRHSGSSAVAAAR